MKRIILAVLLFLNIGINTEDGWNISFYTGNNVNAQIRVYDPSHCSATIPVINYDGFETYDAKCFYFITNEDGREISVYISNFGTYHCCPEPTYLHCDELYWEKCFPNFIQQCKDLKFIYDSYVPMGLVDEQDLYNFIFSNFGVGPSEMSDIFENGNFYEFTYDCFFLKEIYYDRLYGQINDYFVERVRRFCEEYCSSSGGGGDTWDPITDDRINTLAHCLQGIARDYINYMQSAHSIKLRVTDAYRSIPDQDILCDEGSSNACGGESYHNYGLAFDVVEIKNGAALYSNPNWELIGTEGETFGLEWGGRFTSIVDKPHFQLANKTIQELYNGADPCN